MIYPYSARKHCDSATVEHLNEVGPFYWDEGLRKEDLVMCCGSCNSSRGKKSLLDWFETQYCVARGIGVRTVAREVKDYIFRTFANRQQLNP